MLAFTPNLVFHNCTVIAHFILYMDIENKTIQLLKYSTMYITGYQRIIREITIWLSIVMNVVSYDLFVQITITHHVHCGLFIWFIDMLFKCYWVNITQTIIIVIIIADVITINNVLLWIFLSLSLLSLSVKLKIVASLSSLLLLLLLSSLLS